MSLIENLTIPIQMQLSHKQKNFSRFLAPFFKARLNFEHFEQKDDPHRYLYFRNYGLRKRSQIYF